MKLTSRKIFTSHKVKQFVIEPEFEARSPGYEGCTLPALFATKHLKVAINMIKLSIQIE